MDSTPNSEKVQKYREYYNENKEQMQSILIDCKNILRDGYIQYLILKENGVEEAVIIKKKKSKRKKNRLSRSYRVSETTYIYGTHPNSKDKTVYIWRVPTSWKNWVENIEIGDMIFCYTKFGISPVVVQEVECLKKCPVKFAVKKVASREIRRNGVLVKN